MRFLLPMINFHLQRKRFAFAVASNLRNQLAVSIRQALASSSHIKF